MARKKSKVNLKNLAEEFADCNRKKATPAVKHFRKLLNKLKVRYKTEKPVHTSKSFYLIDFYIKDKGLCIEIDGGYHNTEPQKLKDKVRDSYLKSQGYVVWRFTNEECFEMTVDTVKAKLATFPDKPQVIRRIEYVEPRPFLPKPVKKKKKFRRKAKSKPIKTAKHLDAIIAHKQNRQPFSKPIR